MNALALLVRIVVVVVVVVYRCHLLSVKSFSVNASSVDSSAGDMFASYHIKLKRRQRPQTNCSF